MSDEQHQAPPNTLTDAYDKLDQDEQAFADVITAMMDKVDAPYRAMAKAGLSLLAVAFIGAGTPLADDASEEDEREAEIAAAYRGGYAQGKEDGEREAVEAIRSVIEHVQNKETTQ